MTSLENHYRRLLSLYPAAHRQRYQREMLSTLMDGASENQKAPRIRETVDLLWNAIWLRLNRDGGPPVRDPRWAAAAAVFGVLGALTIAGLQVMRPLRELGWNQRISELGLPVTEVSWIPFAQGAVWLAVAVAAFLGRRRIAAIASWATVLAMVVVAHDPTEMVRWWTLVVFGGVVASCLTLAQSRSAGRVALSGRHVAVFGGVIAACASLLWVDAMLAMVQLSVDGGLDIRKWGPSPPAMPRFDFVGALPLAAMAAALAVAVWVQAKVDSGLRGRLRAFAWVVLVSYAQVRATPEPDLVQWAALILVPPAVFAIGVIVVRRMDNRRRLSETSRAQR